MNAFLAVLALWSHQGEGGAADVGGSVRAIVAGLQNYDPRLFGADNRADGLAQGLLRLTLEGSLGERLSGEIHVLQSWTSATSSTPGLGGPVGGGALRYRALDGWTWLDDKDAAATLDLDRASVRLRLPWLDVTVGRQPLNFSKAWFWNPLDVFLPFDPRAFDRDYKPGVDAIHVNVPIGESAGVDLVAAAGRTLVFELPAQAFRAEKRPSFAGSAALLRGFATLGGWDLSAQGGKVYGGIQAGAGFAGEVAGFGARGEASYLFASKADPVVLPTGPVQVVKDHARAVIGLDRRFESSLYLAAEYFFDGAGETVALNAALVRMSAGEVPNLGRHLAALLAGYDFAPVLRGQLAVMVNPRDPSALIAPTLIWSASDEADFVCGALIGLGKRPRFEGPLPVLQSEFGTWPNLFFGEFKLHF